MGSNGSRLHWWTVNALFMKKVGLQPRYNRPKETIIESPIHRPVKNRFARQKPNPTLFVRSTKPYFVRSTTRTLRRPFYQSSGTQASYDRSFLVNVQTATPEVFLSFRGAEMRWGFADFLYAMLTDAGIRVFRDEEELERDKENYQQPIQVIEQCKISIPIISKEYASSKNCLTKLGQMVKGMDNRNRIIIPIFYILI